MLLRGAMLRNTAWVHGVVIYTGHETKLMKNSTKAPLKRSSIDRQTNTHILMLFMILLALSLLSAVCNELWMRNHNDWYIGLTGTCQNNHYLLGSKSYCCLYVTGWGSEIGYSSSSSSPVNVSTAGALAFPMDGIGRLVMTHHTASADWLGVNDCRCS
ncbi:hypothetical protein evm_009314 [Chilo suppressalis]|nr:hypothetical protein evm_009314 [Chilo suppressalis]